VVVVSTVTMTMTPTMTQIMTRIFLLRWSQSTLFQLILHPVALWPFTQMVSFLASLFPVFAPFRFRHLGHLDLMVLLVCSTCPFLKLLQPGASFLRFFCCFEAATILNKTDCASTSRGKGTSHNHDRRQQLAFCSNENNSPSFTFGNKKD
jgi:hypothetical protein